MIVYVAGPYRGEVDRNIQQAREIAIELWQMGHTALCPHLNTAHFEIDCKVEDSRYLSGDLELLCWCGAIVMTPDWEKSTGARGEYEYAVRNKIPVYVYPDMPPVHPTEARRPIQAEAFRETLARMYRVHLDKNADYSPANILGTGWVGLVTRLWDKMARMMNLTGFKIEISSSEFELPKTPKNESVEDTLMDMAVYAIIGLVLRLGKWGK